MNDIRTRFPTKKNKENPWINLLINVVAPALILNKLSKDQYLGQVWSLVLALALPLFYGLYDYIKNKKMNFFSALGLINVLLTGGIGLMKFDRTWMVVKETAIPLIIGLVIFFSHWTKKPLVRTFLDQIIDIQLVDDKFKEHGHDQEFEKELAKSNVLLSSTFFVSATLNYILAVNILVGEPGSVEFNESLGEMTFWSYPIIALPTSFMLMGIMFYLFRSIKKTTGLEIENVMRGH